ncbi:hypothetical protein OG21DRAFT_1511893 [Imleria badia]|nr:hypothetical protein OG21DRAFT_1511893 [Imleria badia]
MPQRSSALKDNQWTYNAITAVRDVKFDGSRTKIHANQWPATICKLDQILSGWLQGPLIALCM